MPVGAGAGIRVSRHDERELRRIQQLAMRYYLALRSLPQSRDRSREIVSVRTVISKASELYRATRRGLSVRYLSDSVDRWLLRNSPNMSRVRTMQVSRAGSSARRRAVGNAASYLHNTVGAFASRLRRQVPAAQRGAVQSQAIPQARRRSRKRGFRGFGDAEEVVTEAVEETVGPAANDGLKMAVTVGALGVLGIGLYYGLTTKSYTGRRIYRGTA